MNRVFRLINFFLLCFLVFINSCIPTKKENSLLKVKTDFLTQTFIQKVKNFDFERIPPSLLDNEQKKLLDIVDLIIHSNYEKVEKEIKKQITEQPKTRYLTEYYQLLAYSLIFLSKWKELLPSSNFYFYDPDSVFILARAFSKVHRDTVVYHKKSDTIGFVTSPSGAIVVKVMVNGKLRNFWFDTGTNYTIVSSKTAEDCNLPALVNEKSKAISLTNYRVDVLPSFIQSLRIGEIEFLNQPCLIVDDFNLRMHLLASNVTTEIYGIIGWKSLQNCKFIINYKNRTIIVEQPDSTDKKIGNFFWAGVPFIVGRFSDLNLLFIFDIGAEKSFFTNNIFSKIDFQKVYSQTRKIGSVGGWMYNAGIVVPFLEFNIGNYKITLENIQTIELVKNFFFNVDGIIGMDLLKKAKVSFDILNSNFEILEKY